MNNFHCSSLRRLRRRLWVLPCTWLHSRGKLLLLESGQLNPVRATSSGAAQQVCEAGDRCPRGFLFNLLLIISAGRSLMVVTIPITCIWKCRRQQRWCCCKSATSELATSESATSESATSESATSESKLRPSLLRLSQLRLRPSLSYVRVSYVRVSCV